MLKRLTVIGVILLTMSACIRDRIPEGADLRPGDSLPWFSVTMDDGSVLSTGDLAGKVSVIVFFHTGCPDCQAELPVIQRIHDEFSPEAAVLCISREEDAADTDSRSRIQHKKTVRCTVFSQGWGFPVYMFLLATW